ncbi:MAG: DUF2304 domain-containing protein [Candidatus Nanopelagicales bacterium]
MASLILIILVLVGVFVLWRLSGSAHGGAARRLAFLAFFGVVVLTIAFPETTTVVANRMGIGRGADLILYLTAFGLMFLAAVSYLRSRSIEDRLAHLVSKQAADDAVARWDTRA